MSSLFILQTGNAQTLPPTVQKGEYIPIEDIGFQTGPWFPIKKVMISSEFTPQQRYAIGLASVVMNMNMYRLDDGYEPLKACIEKYATNRDELFTSKPYFRDIRGPLFAGLPFDFEAQQRQKRLSNSQLISSVFDNVREAGDISTLYINRESLPNVNAIAWASVKEWRDPFFEPLVIAINQPKLQKDIDADGVTGNGKYWAATIFHEVLHVLGYSHVGGDVSADKFEKVKTNLVYVADGCFERSGKDREPDDLYLAPDDSWFVD